MFKYNKFVLSILVVFLLISCSKKTIEEQLKHQDLDSFINFDKKTITILHIDDFTGSVERERTLSNTAGIDAAVNYINNSQLLPHQFKFIVKDFDLGKYTLTDLSSKRKMFNDLKKMLLISGGVVGPLTSTDVRKVKPILVSFDIPVIYPISTANGIAESNGNMYQILPANDILGLSSTLINKNFDLKNAMVWAQKKDDSYGMSYNSSYSKFLPILFKDAHSQFFTGNYDNEDDIMSALDFAEKMQADVIFAPVFLKTSYEKIFKAMIRKGVDIPIITGDSAYKISKMPGNLKMYFIGYFNASFPNKDKHLGEFQAYNNFIKDKAVKFPDASGLYYMSVLFLSSGYAKALNSMNFNQKYHPAKSFLIDLNKNLHAANIDSFIGILDNTNPGAKLKLEISEIDKSGLHKLKDLDLS